MIDKVGDQIISEMEFPCSGDVSYSKETTSIGKKIWSKFDALKSSQPSKGGNGKETEY